MSNDMQPTLHGPTVGEHAAKIAEGAEILFDQPNMVPGRPGRNLSPREMVNLTHEPRECQDDDPGIWLTETRLGGVGKQGVQLLRQHFTGLDGIELTTGPKNRVRRDLVLRYDRARLARGVLEELEVLERDEHGIVHPLARLVRSDIARLQIDYSVLLRERAEYVNDLLAKVKKKQGEYVQLEAGTNSLNELVAAVQARQRLQVLRRQDPMVATPMWEGQAQRSEPETEYTDMLATRPDAAEAPPEVPFETRLTDLLGKSAPDEPGDDEGEAKDGANGGEPPAVAQVVKRSRAKTAGKPAKSSRTGSVRRPAAELPLGGGGTGLADLLSSAPRLHVSDPDS
jgi:hypothetical protein